MIGNKMKKETTKYNDLLNKVIEWENSPVDTITFNARVLKKYGQLYFSGKYKYKTGEAYEFSKNNIQSVKLEQIASELKLNNSEEMIDEAPMMEVPKNLEEKWFTSSPLKYTDDFKNKKAILDEYLKSLSEEESYEAINLMCQNLKNKNYFDFLDIPMDSLTEEQKMLSEDIIEFFNNKNQNQYNKNRDAINLSNFRNNDLRNNNESQETTRNDDAYYNVYDNRSFNKFRNENSRTTPWFKNNEYFNNNEAEAEINAKNARNDYQSESNNYSSIFNNKNNIMQQQNFFPIVSNRNKQNKFTDIFSNKNENDNYDSRENRNNLFGSSPKQFNPSQSNQNNNFQKLNSVPNMKNLNSINNSPVSRKSYNIISINPCYNIGDLIESRNSISESNRKLKEEIVKNTITINNSIVSNLNIVSNNRKNNVPSKKTPRLDFGSIEKDSSKVKVSLASFNNR